MESAGLKPGIAWAARIVRIDSPPSGNARLWITMPGKADADWIEVFGDWMQRNPSIEAGGYFVAHEGGHSSYWPALRP